MSDLKHRLQTALGDAYRLEKELGGGGMSRVFLAEEVELGRKVVVKVLPPEMAAGVNAERFRREIQMAASLQHPHIVPLLHAGHAQDLVYYTMPFIEGDSLRVKLTREGELPIPEAVRILRDVADALTHAHQHGVVHRDIKPDNVLLTGRHAVVTDFGVAKAVSEATGRTSLTSMGVALGTPAYMAPEQAAADPHVDHRADIYALGALAYEMLTGRPPFTGTSPQAVLAAQVTQAPEPLTQHRAAVPPGIAALVMRCLEKKPADRWQSAAEVHQQLEVMATPSGGTTPTAAVPATPRRRPGLRPALAVTAGLVVVGAGGFAIWRSVATGGTRAVDSNVVAILPFRVAGADPALHYLREGMIDLLAAKLTGEGGPRAADPRTVTSAWRRAVGSEHEDLGQDVAIKVARDIGAGQLLLGGIVGAPGRVVLSATLVAVPGGATRAQASTEGPADSLPGLVDRLAAQLLVRGAALGEQRQVSLATTSLEALQAYLAGQAAYRRGDYDEAARHLGRAVQLDSTFALAAFALVVTASWGPNVPDFPRVERLAWAGRERLSQRDRVLLEAYLGPHYPEPPLEADLLAARERAVGAAPDQPDAWYFLGDKYFHQGRYLGSPDWMDRAAAGFGRALALDSTFAGPLSHMVDLAVFRGDTAGVRRLGTLYLSVPGASRGGYAIVVRWGIAHTLRDSALLREVWASFDTMPSRPAYLPLVAQWEGVGTGELNRLLEILARRASTQAERVGYLNVRVVLLMNQGRPREALVLLDSAARLTGRDVLRAEFETLAALYWDADSGTGSRAARRLAPLAEGALADSAERRAQQYDAGCALGQWRLAHGELGTAPRTIARLRSAAAPRDSAFTVRSNTVCAALLEAALATAQRRPEARRLVERADSIMRLGPATRTPLSNENLLLGRLFATLGDPGRALAAVRRGAFFGRNISSSLREEGRLAALTGDRAGAIRAYEHYLALRPDPEPELKAEMEQVRGELARLVAER